MAGEGWGGGQWPPHLTAGRSGPRLGPGGLSGHQALCPRDPPRPLVSPLRSGIDILPCNSFLQARMSWALVATGDGPCGKTGGLTWPMFRPVEETSPH